MTNLLKRGADPYADAAEAAKRSGMVQFQIDATRWAAGGSLYLPCPFRGRVRELRVVVDTANSANASVVGVAIGTETLGSVTVASAAPVGTSYRAQISDDSDNFNLVDTNDVLIVHYDGAPSAGAVNGVIWIDPEL